MHLDRSGSDAHHSLVWMVITSHAWSPFSFSLCRRVAGVQTEKAKAPSILQLCALRASDFREEITYTLKAIGIWLLFATPVSLA